MNRKWKVVEGRWQSHVEVPISNKILFVTIFYKIKVNCNTLTIENYVGFVSSNQPKLD
jgi:hypothetical protein